jgi:mono/diheme cytochrome c family protein
MKRAGVVRGELLGSALAVGVVLAGGLALRCGSTPALPAARNDATVARTDQPTAPAAANPLANGKRLYTQHCAACHGDQGDGNGPAARFLYPRPRNFGEAKFRLASTANAIPSDDDLLSVITHGMPGSAMFPFGHLTEAERKSLVAYVRDLTRSSFIRAVQRDAAERGDKVDPAELERDAAEVLKPGEPVALPAAWPANDAASVARGKASYLKTCAACHGESGKGDGVQEQKNNDGTPTAPRDFTRGIFKGGRERDRLFARIMLGMAGTPMPGSQGVPPEEICDLVHFIQSLSPANAQTLVEHRRTTVTARRVSGPLPAAVPEAVWAAGPAARIVVSPLWWRNYSEPELTVRAVHDGRTVALRLTWRDESCNDRIVKPDDFEDMAAVQLFQGQAEPFLGMGAANATLDLWLWRASWQYPRDFANSQLDDYPFDTPFYRDRLRALGRPVPDFQTARAAGNPHTHGDATRSASTLAAKGFGTTTFLPKALQIVSAKSAWKDSRWTVDLRRPLAVGPDGGMALAPGGRCSVAFALWDGAARDRNGQKAVSIWHDLKLDD